MTSCWKKLDKLNLAGIKEALEEQRGQPQNRYLSFEARLSQLLDRELEEREKRRTRNCARKRQGLPYKVGNGRSGLFHSKRSGVKSLMVSLSSCGWLLMHHNVVVTGPAGIGKNLYCLCTGWSSL